MSILVTGAGGFVGREVVRKLLERGDNVIAMDHRLSGLAPHDRLHTVEGNLSDKNVRAQALDQGIDALVHLAAVPGAAAEADPQLSRQVNINATTDLLEEAAQASSCPRVVFASTIAVYGDPLPANGVTDKTPLAPRMIYGAHKAMCETLIATMTRRGDINGLSLRLPGILARPKGPSGMKSAFMSDLFHALIAGEGFVSPVSEAATMWLMSVDQCADNILHGLDVPPALLPENRAFGLPALRISMGELVAAVAKATHQNLSKVTYAPDPELEAGFGAYPALQTAAADTANFKHDGTVDALVGKAIATIQSS